MPDRLRRRRIVYVLPAQPDSELETPIWAIFCFRSPIRRASNKEITHLDVSILEIEFLICYNIFIGRRLGRYPNWF